MCTIFLFLLHEFYLLITEKQNEGSSVVPTLLPEAPDEGTSHVETSGLSMRWSKQKKILMKAPPKCKKKPRVTIRKKATSTKSCDNTGEQGHVKELVSLKHLVKLRKSSQVGILPDIRKCSESDQNTSTNRLSC